MSTLFTALSALFRRNAVADIDETTLRGIDVASGKIYGYGL